MPHTLRPAVLADVPSLSAFASAHFPDAAPSVVPREFVTAFVSENLDEASFTRYIETGAYSFTLAVNEAGDIIAYSGIDHEAPQPAEIPGNAAYLSKVYLSAETRGTGLARELMDAAIAAARADGKDGLYLGTHQLNHRAQAFYEKMGFTRVGERTFQLTATEVAHDYIYHLSI